jgi:hypothetical protein
MSDELGMDGGPSQEEIAARAAAARGENAPAPESIWGDEEAEELARKKGWQTPAQALKSYAAAEAQMTKQSQELAEYKSQVDALTDYVQELNQQTPRGESPNISQVDMRTEVGQWVNQFADPVTGEIDMVAMKQAEFQLQAQVAAASLEQQKQALAEMLDERLGPIQSRAEAQESDEAHAELMEAYGDQYEAVNDAAVELVESQPEVWDAIAERVGLGEAMKMAHAAAAQQMTTQTVRQQREQADAFTIGSGSRGVTQGRRTSEQVEKDAIFGAAPQKGDFIFGGGL